MGLFDRLTGGKRRADLRLMLDGLSNAARSEIEFHRADSWERALWALVCDGAEEVTGQLLVKKRDRRVDWGLRGSGDLIDRGKLLTIYWWMLLYQLVLASRRSTATTQESDDLEALEAAARSFVEKHAGEFSPPLESPRPWDDRWDQQFPLESAMGIYNSVYELLELPNDPQKRINRVSDFTTATERAFDQRSTSVAP